MADDDILDRYLQSPRERFVNNSRADALSPRAAQSQSDDAGGEETLSDDVLGKALDTVYSEVSNSIGHLSQARAELLSDWLEERDPAQSALMATLGDWPIPASVSRKIDLVPVFQWLEQGSITLRSLRGEARSQLDTGQSAGGEERTQALAEAADILALTAVACDILLLHTAYLGVWKALIDAGARGPQLLSPFIRAALLFFETIQPFIEALLADERDLAWRIFVGIEVNINHAARPALAGFLKAVEKGAAWSQMAIFVGDLILFAVDAWEMAQSLSRGLRGPGGMMPPPSGLVGAQIAYAIPMAVGYQEALMVVYSVAAASASSGTFGTSRRRPLPPAFLDRRLPGWLRDWLRRVERTFPKLRFVRLRAVAPGKMGPGIFDERVRTGLPVSFSAELPENTWPHPNRKLQIDGFTEQVNPVEVRLRSDPGTGPLRDVEPDLVDLISGNEAAGAPRNFAELEEAKLRRELGKRARFVEFCELPEWLYQTDSPAYAATVRRVIGELNLGKYFRVELLP